MVNVRQSLWLTTALVGTAQAFPVTATTSTLAFSSRVGLPHNNHHRGVGTLDKNNNPFYSIPAFSTRLFSTFALDDNDDDDNNNDVGQHDLHDDNPTFDSLVNLHPSLKSALTNAGLVNMTQVQHKTWEAASGGSDVLARARTGTGKTVAFLLPAIQQIVTRQAKGASQKHPSGIDILILSPTRELASQIHEQAKLLTANLPQQQQHQAGQDTAISSQVIFGGTDRAKDVKLFEKRHPTILVATPGRLKDHLESTRVRGAKFSDLLKHTSILVLDETDRYVCVCVILNSPT